MDIEEYVKLTMLFDLYGKLLSKTQFDVMDKFINLNLSESELAGIDSKSRQSIHDAVVKAKKQLFDFEDKCQILSKKLECLEELENFKNSLVLTKQQNQKFINIIEDIKNI